MANIKVVGLSELGKKLKKNVTLDDVKNVVRHNGAELQKKIQENADFTQGYQTGQTKRSVNLEIYKSGFTAEAGVDKTYSEKHPTTEYAPYVEYGTRFMDAQPFVKPALEKQADKFEKDMKKLVR